jgi:hypothetical protein
VPFLIEAELLHEGLCLGPNVLTLVRSEKRNKTEKDGKRRKKTEKDGKR